eukprot:TRINITY_DN33784_c0_g1_i1.p1 TRINITY_DN33784_c0_g1~~TRINITY_DN33784_c0_g1_i1.p1  ORF type:complete len:651 (+),score=128.89 TRINITY_DN33784_c0_g1_i1:53-1954(+)
MPLPQQPDSTDTLPPEPVRRRSHDKIKPMRSSADLDFVCGRLETLLDSAVERINANFSSELERHMKPPAPGPLMPVVEPAWGSATWPPTRRPMTPKAVMPDDSVPELALPGAMELTPQGTPPESSPIEEEEKDKGSQLLRDLAICAERAPDATAISVTRPAWDDAPGEAGRQALHRYNTSADLADLRNRSRSYDSVKVQLNKRNDAFNTFNGNVRNAWKIRRNIQVIVHDTKFELVASVAVVLCALAIGAQVNWAMQNVKDDLPVFFRVSDLLFLVVFTIELVLRLVADGSFFVRLDNPELRWNIMDILLVSFALVEEVIATSASNDALAGMLDVTFLRTLRMFRLVRIARLIRVVRFFSELRIMVHCMLGSAKSLLWALLLLSLIMFMFGVTVMQILHTYLQSHMDEIEADQNKLTMQMYGTLYRTMQTLFACISGGMDWRDAVTPLNPVHDGMELLFSAYIFFTLFCCLNIVTAIFVDNANDLKQQDEDAMHAELMKESKQWAHEVAELFAKVDTSQDGQFTFSEFEHQLRTNQRVRTCFEKLGIDVITNTADELWDLFDLDESGQVDVDEFSGAIRHFQGQARSIDVFKVRQDTRRIGRDIQQLVEKLSEQTPGDTHGLMTTRLTETTAS